MKIKIANTYEYYLDQTFELEQRKEFVNNLLKTVISLDNLTITVEGYFRKTWNKQNTKVCLDILSYYLSKGIKEKQKHDTEVLSRTKEKEMNKWNNKYETFSDLSKENKILFGFEDIDK